jgi:hypothetical protein
MRVFKNIKFHTNKIDFEANANAPIFAIRLGN